MKKSFTLIELLITVSIISIFSTIGIAYYNKYSQEVLLRNEANKLANVIELAKKKAYSSDIYQSCDDFSGYRITINSGDYLLRFGCGGSFTTVVQTYPFPTNITTISGTGDFTFKPLGIGTNITIGAIRLKNSNLNQCIDISISSIGLVEINETLISC